MAMRAILSQIPISTTEAKHLEDTTNDRESSQLSENHALETPDEDKNTNNHRTDKDDGGAVQPIPLTDISDMSFEIKRSRYNSLPPHQPGLVHHNIGPLPHVLVLHHGHSGAQTRDQPRQQMTHSKSL